MKLFVGNVPTNSNPVELRQLFEEYGRVSECEIIKDYAFIHMPSDAEANKARQSLMYYNFNGSRLNVRRSTSPVPRKSSSYASYSILKPSPKNKKKWPQPPQKSSKIIETPQHTLPNDDGPDNTAEDSSSPPALEENVGANKQVAVGYERHSAGLKEGDMSNISGTSDTAIETDDNLEGNLGTTLSFTPHFPNHLYYSSPLNIPLGYETHVQCSAFITEEDIIPSYSELAKQMESFCTRPLEAWSLENAHG